MDRRDYDHDLLHLLGDLGKTLEKIENLTNRYHLEKQEENKDINKEDKKEC